jgi:uncharacterized coiled-coil DUF342 family protein
MPNYKKGGPAWKYLKGKKAINQGNPGIGTLSNKPKGQYAPANLINVNNVGGGAMNVPTYVSPDQAIAYGASVGFKYVIGIPAFCGEENECLETLRSPSAELCGTEGFEGPALIISSNHEVTIGPELYEFGLALFEASEAVAQSDALSETIPALQKERDDITTRTKEAAAAVAQTRDEVEQIQNDIDSLETEISSDSDQLAQILEQFAGNKSAREKLGCADQTEPDEKCAELIKEGAELSKQIAELEANISEKQAELLTKISEKDALTKLLEVYEATLATLQEQEASIQNRLDSRQNAISELKEGAENLNKKAQDIKDCVVNYSVAYYQRIGLTEASLEAAMSIVNQTYITFDQAMQENSEEPKS